MDLIKLIGFVRLFVIDLIMVINLVMNIEPEKLQTTNYKPQTALKNPHTTNTSFLFS